MTILSLRLEARHEWHVRRNSIESPKEYKLVKQIIIMKKKNIVLLIAIITLIILVCVAWLNQRSTSTCSELESQIQDKIKSMNYCNADDDCAIKNFGCPFDCGGYVNINSDVRSIEQQSDKYRGLCGVCKYECLPVLKPVCINNKCVGPQCELNKEYKFNECECPEGTAFSQVYNEEKKDWIYICKSGE